MIDYFSHDRNWSRHDLKTHYDAVIVGAGVHGLATAYYLAKQGFTKVALLEKGYLGYGNSGRNTAIVRSNYRTPEGVPFYKASLELYEGLTQELGFNIMLSQRGHLTLAHTESAIAGLRVRAEVNKCLGVDSRIIWPDEIKALEPALDMSQDARYPIQAALLHPPGGILRHDAVVWGYAKAIEKMGAEIHTHTELTGIDVEGGKVTGVTTSRGKIKTPIVVNATSGWCSHIAAMAGVKLPISSFALEACVSEPLKPIVSKVLVSASLHIYVNQTDRGELVIGAEIDPYACYNTRAIFPTLEQMAAYTLDLLPCAREARILRQWAGTCDMTPDFSPILGEIPGVKGFIVDVGWGTYGFKAGPIGGKLTADLILTGKAPELAKPFAYQRFIDGPLSGEKAAAATSH
jgi:sarcosine oxidase subunit beta